MCMEYLRSVWAALLPAREAPAPPGADLEDGCGGEHRILLVLDAADACAEVRPLLRARDAWDASAV